MAPALTETRVEQLRAHLPTVQGRAYLNAGTTGPMPDASIAAQVRQLEAEGRDRQPRGMWEHLGTAQQATRARIARLVGGDPSQVALMHATHEGINSCLWGCALGSDDVVVTTDEEHPGVLAPLRCLRDRAGIEVRIVAWPDDPGELMANVEAALDGRVRVVVVSHVSWVSGKVAPLRDLAALLAPRGVRLVVDGAQGAGALPVDVADGWDAYTVSGQKWPAGPHGSGGVVLADPERWAPTFGAYFTTTSPYECLTAPYQRDGRRLECCQEAPLPLVGLAASLDFLLDEVGVQHAAERSHDLNLHARRKLVDLGVVAPEDAHVALGGEAHLLTIARRAGDAVELNTALASEGIVVRDLRPDLLRVSFGYWNTTDEVDLLATAIAAFDAR